jgi:hypothetical protein
MRDNSRLPNSEQLYKDNLPLGSFAITIGIFIVFSVTLQRIFLRQTLSRTGEIIFWMGTWLNSVFIFAVALEVTVNYVLQQQSFAQIGIPMPTESIIPLLA